MTHQEESESEALTINPDEAGERLDKILAERFASSHSRSYFQHLIETGCVLLNGVPTKKRIKPAAGDEIEVAFALTPEMDLTPENIPLDILFEDDDLLIVNKPAGMVVHPAVGNWSGTFVNALLFHCKQLSSIEGVRPGIVHRLDKDTTGVLVAAKHPLAQQRMIKLFSERKISKTYKAVCIGNPGNIDINVKIGRHPGNRKKMAVVDEGREAITLCRTLGVKENLCLVELILVTGRTHQIRVHLQHLRTPVLGDLLYGSSTANKRYNVYRQMLHASKIEFVHPCKEILVSVEAPMPSDMALLAGKIR